jgi:Tol biopolymer transport system component
MDASGENLRTLVSAAGERFGTPSLSPDGDTLLYDRSSTGAFGTTHIYTLRIGAEEKAKDLGAGNAPNWSPDGSLIAFHITAENRDAIKPGVWVMNADGTKRTWLFEGKAARFSSDGKRLLFVDNPDGQGEGIYQFDLDTNEITAMLDHAYRRVAGACWSPDGKRIAVIVRHANDAELLLVATEGDDRSATIRLTADIGYRPNWSPDGKHLLLWVRNEEGRRQLHRLEVEGESVPEKLAHQDESEFNSDGIWSPDGKQILWSRN